MRDTHEPDTSTLEDGVDTTGPDTAAPEVDEPDTAVDDDAADTTTTPGDAVDTTTPGDTHDASDDVESDGSIRLLRCLPDGCTAIAPGCELQPDYCFIAGQCVADRIASDDNECQVCDAKKAPLVWSKAAEGASCDDGVSCTADDVCVAGACKGEDDCGGATACSTQECNLDAGQCEDAVDPGRCLVDGQCFSAGQTTGDRCSVCRPDLSSTAWTPGDGSEPDEELDFANPLGSLDDVLVTHGSEQDPGWHGPWVSSTLAPSTDVDSFGFVYPTNSGFTRPTIRVSRAGVEPVEACVFIRCLNSEVEQPRPTAVVACGGSDTKKTEGDWVGCCHTFSEQGFPFTPAQAWCEVSGQKLQNHAEAVASLRRKPPSPEPACLPYVLRWGMR